MKMLKPSMLLVALLAVAACSSSGTSTDTGGSTGGGSTGGGSTVAPGGELPDGNATVQGRAISATVSGDGSTQFTLGTFGAPQALSVEVGDDTDDGPETLAFTSGGVTVVLNDTIVDEDDRINGLVSVVEDADGTNFFSTEGPDEDDLTYTDFGAWVQLDTSDPDEPATSPLFFGVVGAPTPAAQMPTSGNATYTGRTIGAVNTAGGARTTTSDVTVTTPDFSAITVKTSNTLREADDDDSDFGVSASNLDFTASGSITGSGYTATGGGMTVDGDFYGPSAEETSGLFRGAIGGQTYGGAFGAKQ